MDAGRPTAAAAPDAAAALPDTAATAPDAAAQPPDAAGGDAVKTDVTDAAEPKVLIEGQPFGPIVIVEHSNRVRSCGTGLLRVSGVAMKDGVARIQHYLPRPTKSPRRRARRF